MMSPGRWALIQSPFAIKDRLSEIDDGQISSAYPSFEKEPGKQGACILLASSLTTTSGQGEIA
jgi:hypothetical protein